MADLKRTPLYAYYLEHKVKVVDFGGWAMPIQFSGIMKEHEAVRERVGLFDCSHMGEIEVTGPGAEAYLNHMLTNNITRLTDGGVQYNVFCFETGGAIDDVMVYRKDGDHFLVVCNASNTEKVWEWMNEHLNQDVHLENRTNQIGLIAVQGPKAEEVLQAATETNLADIKRHRFQEMVAIGGVANILISRTGYTGEDGFELYVDADQTEALWKNILAEVEKEGGLPCGLGARDTLRLEAGLPLYGHELSAEISPIMAGVGFAVKTKKTADFIGKEALAAQRTTPPTKKIAGFKMNERGIPRPDYRVLSMDEQPIGEVTSGTQSPTLKEGIGMALIDSNQAEIGTKVLIEVRNKLIPAVIVEKPFV